ncbi:hypothetical protein L211DRAFT_877158 [Terfezia boudieri ATCC MYA-4762]|uniref:Uncharacterized protein n=1 Tax=Terfezia boudieri ATCC MYA-4762 TaxID=1051890 RepID=A0A3N4LT44_9PEZI|nr:hypothetical protein L211DRAFT_877158 [Terfezia boudieri ATCC MYA-4762]
MSPETYECPVYGCTSTNSPRSRFIEHIETHTKPYICRNLNVHRQKRHFFSSSSNLFYADVIQIGGVHDQIRTYRDLEDLISLLQSLEISIKSNLLGSNALGS